ncbi:ankyrin repeat domain-containing protein [Marinobacter koreensis]|uniref:Ankyrin repeat domain-containing protein n=1 Tax=Marinobacter koreensis TaxID=335974 RepID=A0ABW0RNS9_9GAMM|nr:ankyrin repeat domain-containing protein [Marinobacter koreensis]MCK7548704.1 ankyrin repeat domain-containing protein [Marinobacter koreensis]MDX1817615.1 ankyrin repeat domain-containing protein [Marinobacter sp.]
MSSKTPGSPRPPETQQDEDAIALAQGMFDLARNGGSTMLRPLLQAGLPVDIRTTDGDSLLMLASENGQSDTVELLLEMGATVDHRNNRGQTPLMVAALSNRCSIIARLLKAGADADARDRNGRTALELAQQEGALEAAAELRG